MGGDVNHVFFKFFNVVRSILLKNNGRNSILLIIGVVNEKFKKLNLSIFNSVVMITDKLNQNLHYGVLYIILEMFDLNTSSYYKKYYNHSMFGQT